ncbi:phosphoribosylaminoimidazolesuccinocarboxamide synthase [Halalkalicoccus jeotgali]|uniref:phosphoribosylaminoimidazolesuccinocarboxamide synthase n=1 Tax=Halalkalicoccus jeotgali (strain DSM 18796 / CECT 7217 / JCM 14584 / KCTC 4019 / B3) TaxID=795797 RepID=D8J9F8_HALJB|nr:phosphoribosylaminoimidazolesuccinocarboxamide synthase [Halalkalicoccus jeotgali]ADJ14370.1 phosphoribosylaminoimidazole-succinocarboxamide synthase [Halalkalicoccus jeotgali B3]ELY40631.1 phosphoribosylaminoimidazole-succinocarboxamide synthase [Halalkalicoccus jeotgali B3]
MTSVKEFHVEHEPTASEPGVGAFVFTDAYSVFDWGRMPDAIPRKGASLCTMGAFNFESLESAGVPTHYRGVGEDARALAEVENPPVRMAIDLVQVPELPHEGRAYDYDAYHTEAGENYLVPLEIVFRNRVPEGSSLRRRSEPGEHGLDFEEWPDRPVELEEPIVEFSTKYEESDRYLAREEAETIAGKADLAALESVAHEVERVVSEQARSTGFVHEDGKIECCYVDGEVRVADVVGTFDENRFSYAGQQLSKEVLRGYHKRTQPDWVEAVESAKDDAKSENIADWRALCGRDPEPLPTEVVDLASEMYAAGTNAYTDEEWFAAPPIDAVIERVRSL